MKNNSHNSREKNNEIIFGETISLQPHPRVGPGVGYV